MWAPGRAALLWLFCVMKFLEEYETAKIRDACGYFFKGEGAAIEARSPSYYQLNGRGRKVCESHF